MPKWKNWDWWLGRTSEQLERKHLLQQKSEDIKARSGAKQQEIRDRTQARRAEMVQHWKAGRAGHDAPPPPRVDESAIGRGDEAETEYDDWVTDRAAALRRLEARYAPTPLTPEFAATAGELARAQFEAKRIEQRTLQDYEDLRAFEDRAGEVEGRHFTEWIEALDRLRAIKDDVTAEPILRECIAAAERAARVQAQEPAPAYTTRLAIILRRQKRLDEEIAILERWIAAWPKVRGPVSSTGKVADRPEKAKELRDRSS